MKLCDLAISLSDTHLFEERAVLEPQRSVLELPTAVMFKIAKAQMHLRCLSGQTASEQ